MGISLTSDTAVVSLMYGKTFINNNDNSNTLNFCSSTPKVDIAQLIMESKVRSEIKY